MRRRRGEEEAQIRALKFPGASLKTPALGQRVKTPTAPTKPGPVGFILLCSDGLRPSQGTYGQWQRGTLGHTVA